MEAGVWRAARKATAKGWSFQTMQQPGSLNPGAALESDGRVKLLTLANIVTENKPYEACLRLGQKASGQARVL